MQQFVDFVLEMHILFVTFLTAKTNYASAPQKDTSLKDFLKIANVILIALIVVTRCVEKINQVVQLLANKLYFYK